MGHALRHLEPSCGVNTCVKVHEKITVWGCSVHTPSVTVDRNQLQNETNCNKKERIEQNKCELTSNSIRMSTTTRNLKLKANVAILYVGQLERCPCCIRLCWPGWMGSSIGSPDLWCKRFFTMTAALYSDRSFIDPFFPTFVQSKIPLSLVSSLVLWSEFVCMVFFRKFVPLFALLFWPSDCEFWVTINWISEKSIVNTCKMITLGVRLSYSISSTHSKPNGILFVPRSCRVEHHG